jgi:tryptophan synthase beta chain
MSATRTFGEYGGRYVPETLIPALDELEQAWESLRDDAAFQTELARLRSRVRRASRPTSGST